MTAAPRLARLSPGAGLLILLAVAAAAYWPGVGGMFLFDDYENLRGLADLKDAPTWPNALRFIFGGISSDLGRPLSLATFALQYGSWPDSVGNFIAVNILLHLLNVVLFHACAVRILRFARPADPANEWIALGAAALWTFAGLQSSTVLYVVQRMAVLSGTFVFAGLLLYLAGRRRELEGNPRAGFAMMLAGIGIGMPVGLLAKESAALFPLLVLALEHTLLGPLPRSRAWRAMSGVMLWLPGLLIVAYLLTRIPGLLPGLGLRNFTLGERLLTESRVLFLYLEKFLFPPLYGVRLYYDDLPVSRSLLDPWTTLPSLCGWAAVIVAAVAGRRRAPTFSFAVSWYLAAHLLESTVLPLELAFDHRNYVALLGPALALACGTRRLLEWPALARVRPALIAAIAGYLLFITFALWQSARLWGNPWELVHYWGERQPESRRAVSGNAHFYWNSNHPELAAETYRQALVRWPGDPSFFLGQLELGCVFPDLPVPALEGLPPIVAQFDSTAPATVGMLELLISSTEQNLCSRYTPAQLWTMSQMVFETPRLSGFEQMHFQQLARIAALAHDAPLAREMLDKALRLEGSPSSYERAIQWSLEAGDTGCARYYLGRLKSQPSPKLLERWTYEDRVSEFTQRLQAYPERAPSAVCAGNNGATS